MNLLDTKEHFNCFTCIIPSCTIGWSDLEKIMLHILYCAKYLLNPNSKIACLNVASFLGRRASENFKSYHKISKIIFVNTFFQPETGGSVFFDFFIAKNEEKFKNNIFFDLVQIKNSFAHFRKIKNILNKFVSQLYCCRLFFDV